jgi:hypothetical protein
VFIEVMVSLKTALVKTNGSGLRIPRSSGRYLLVCQDLAGTKKKSSIRQTRRSGTILQRCVYIFIPLIVLLITL